MDTSEALLARKGPGMVKNGPDRRDIEVGRRVRTFRLQKGLTQQKLAGRLGLSFQQVQKYEKGTNRIGAGRLEQIAEILGIPVTQFFGTSQHGRDVPHELFETLDTATSLRLFRAYSRIRNKELRNAVILLVEKVAGGRRD